MPIYSWEVKKGQTRISNWPTQTKHTLKKKTNGETEWKMQILCMHPRASVRCRFRRTSADNVCPYACYMRWYCQGELNMFCCLFRISSLMTKQTKRAKFIPAAPVLLGWVVMFIFNINSVHMTSKGVSVRAFLWFRKLSWLIFRILIE